MKLQFSFYMKGQFSNFSSFNQSPQYFVNSNLMARKLNIPLQKLVKKIDVYASSQ